MDRPKFEPLINATQVFAAGTWGNPSQPKLLAALAVDTGNQPGLGVGDAIDLVFNQVVNVAAIDWSYSDVLARLRFNVPIGAIIRKMTGVWISDGQLRLHIDELDTTHALFGRLGMGWLMNPAVIAVNVLSSANIRSIGGTSLPCNDTMYLSGHWGVGPSQLEVTPHSATSFIAEIGSPQPPLDSFRPVPVIDSDSISGNAMASQVPMKLEWCDNPDFDHGTGACDATVRLVPVGTTAFHLVHGRTGWPQASMVPLSPNQPVYVRVTAADSMTSDISVPSFINESSRVVNGPVDGCVCFEPPRMIPRYDLTSIGNIGHAGYVDTFVAANEGIWPGYGGLPALNALDVASVESYLSATQNLQSGDTYQRYASQNYHCIAASNIPASMLDQPSTPAEVQGLLQSRLPIECPAMPIHLQQPKPMLLASTAPVFATSGGQTFSVEGRNLGSTRLTELSAAFTEANDHVRQYLSIRGFETEVVRQGLADIVVPYIVVTYNNTIYRWVAQDCRLQTEPNAHTSIRCAIAEGIGTDMQLHVLVDGTSDSEGLQTNLMLSYDTPVISAFHGPGATGSSTRGGELLLITGNNFGPASAVDFNATMTSPGTPELLHSVAYSSALNASVRFKPRTCWLSRSHIEITCITGPGAASRLFWNVTIGGRRSSMPSTSYGRPSITQACRAKALDGWDSAMLLANVTASAAAWGPA